MHLRPALFAASSKEQENSETGAKRASAKPKAAVSKSRAVYREQ